MDIASYLLEQVRSRGVRQIEEWVKEGLREDLHLDFKRKSSPSHARLDGDDKKNFSKALSGFANSDSGLIVWGVGAPGSGEGVRTRHPLRYANRFAEVLDSHISRAVSPAVTGVENHVVLLEGHKESGYVITYVPKSDSAPHRAEYEGLKHYYKRYGESFKICEHYELEFMFGKRHVPDLLVFWSIDIPSSLRLNPKAEDPVKLRVGINNQGRAIAKYVCLRIRYPDDSFYQLAYEDQSDLIHYSKPMSASKPHTSLITARALQGLVVYPHDYTFIYSFGFAADPRQWENLKLPPFKMSFDLFAEDFHAVVNQKYQISGKKIAEKLRKKWETTP